MEQNVETNDEQEVEQRIEFLTYCHETIDRLKTSIYERASILMVVIAFIVPSGYSVIMDILTTIPKTSGWKIVFAFLGLSFSLSFLIAAYWGIKCIVPIKSRDFLLTILDKSRRNGEKISIEQLRDADLNMTVADFIATQNITSNKKVRVFTTFDHIVDLSENNFEMMAKDLDRDKILEQLISAIYNMSHITKKRYGDLLKAYQFLTVSIFIFIILISVDIINKIYNIL